MGTRSEEILRAAIKELENNADPFSAKFLTENFVTLDECLDLATQLALGARLLLKATRPELRNAVIEAVTDQIGLPQAHET